MINKISEYCSTNDIASEKEFGKIENNILDPSSGGIGIKLNIPKARLTMTMVDVMK